MSLEHIDIGIVVSRRRVSSDWIDHVWLVRAALPAVPAAPVGTILHRDDQETCSFAGSASLTLYPALTAHYRDNLTAEHPVIWVQLRAAAEECQIRAATVDPYEGEAMGEGFGNLAEAVAMPQEVQSRLRAFVEVFHIERPFVKRKRRLSLTEGGSP